MVHDDTTNVNGCWNCQPTKQDKLQKHTSTSTILLNFSLDSKKHPNNTVSVAVYYCVHYFLMQYYSIFHISSYACSIQFGP
jgi:hypothetical protein